jgi:3-oxoacyl-[acyl-carrier protein] reductase
LIIIELSKHDSDTKAGETTMSQKLKNKTALVTGASKGIGAGIAKALAAEGASVVVNYASSREGAERVVAQIREHGGDAIAVQGDVARASDVRRLLAETKEAYGTLDVLVNNAGVFHFDPLEEVTEGEFHRQFDTNVLGPILTTREALPLFGPDGGSVINISSVAGAIPPLHSVVYSATKGALDSVTRELALELGPRKIRVNGIAPGGVETEGVHRAGIIGSDFEREMIARTTLGRLGQPDDIARIAVFLASPESGWMTGETITASGGYR